MNGPGKFFVPNTMSVHKNICQENDSQPLNRSRIAKPQTAVQCRIPYLKIPHPGPIGGADTFGVEFLHSPGNRDSQIMDRFIKETNDKSDQPTH